MVNEDPWNVLEDRTKFEVVQSIVQQCVGSSNDQ